MSPYRKSQQGPIIENGVISEIRANGFLVFVPRFEFSIRISRFLFSSYSNHHPFAPYISSMLTLLPAPSLSCLAPNAIDRFGIKGPVYLKDKDGNPVVPTSLLSGNQEEGSIYVVSRITAIYPVIFVLDSTYISNCTLSISPPTTISVQIHGSPLPIIFGLFDKVRISLKLHMSHAHRHSVYMTLIGLHQSEPAIKKTIGERQLLPEITEGERHRLQRLTIENVAESGLDTFVFRQTEVDNSAYGLLEKFRRMAIIELGNG
ncbi:hypothetical protein BC936DRAFT_136881 [Jimgerdemannia flammicorona]|uniref:Uncharacterized protein n=1 Tax=Jimgerdemannia flammicorona TaxID=994334 RepID=A0A433DJA1_9FUNG|nr:hypothetical protein BC936DRAFT_136881 [Jimgerdemannia flammicorona]